MGTKVKGLLKGLKHLSITNIFDEKEQEDEIQIGFPTDVKHVAHIGMDDANTTTKPSWMTDYKAAPELASAEAAAKGEEDGEKKPRKRSDKDKESSNHRTRKSKDSINLGDSEDLPVPKTARKKKNKGSSVARGDGSTKGSSRSKGHHSSASLPDLSFSDESAHGSKREHD